MMNHKVYLSGVAGLFVAAILSMTSLASAQAYVNQAVKQADPSAYVGQLPTNLRPAIVKPRKTAGHTQARTTKNLAKPSIALPTVGAGSSAILKASFEEESWPTVGKGTVSR